MAEQEIRRLRPLCRGQLAQLLHVRHDLVPAVVKREEAEAVRAENALAVAEMVVADDDKALGGQEPCKIRITAYVLVYPVRDLHNAVYIAVRYPLADVDGRNAVGGAEGVIIFGYHRHFHLPPVVLSL